MTIRWRSGVKLADEVLFVDSTVAWACTPHAVDIAVHQTASLSIAGGFVRREPVLEVEAGAVGPGPVGGCVRLTEAQPGDRVLGHVFRQKGILIEVVSRGECGTGVQQFAAILCVVPRPMVFSALVALVSKLLPVIWTVGPGDGGGCQQQQQQREKTGPHDRADWRHTTAGKHCEQKEEERRKAPVWDAGQLNDFDRLYDSSREMLLPAHVLTQYKFSDIKTWQLQCYKSSTSDWSNFDFSTIKNEQLFFTAKFPTPKLLRARPKAERVFTEYENFLKLSDPTDRPTDRPTVTLFSVLYLLNQATDWQTGFGIWKPHLINNSY